VAALTRRNASQKPWSSKDDTLARDWYLEGRSLAFIATELERTPHAIEKHLERLGVSRRAVPHVPSERSHGLSGASGDILADLADLQGLSPISDAITPSPDRDVLRTWVEDPEAFFHWLGVNLFPYQQEALGIIRSNDRVALVWPRQHGKDMLTGLYGLWRSVVTPSAIVVCVSPSQRQSDLWMDKLKAFSMSRRELRERVTDLSQSEIAFSNGSRVYSLPSGSQGSATIRGFSRVSVVVANEAAWISDETFQAVSPFLAVTGKAAKLILASTPFGQRGFLWRSFNSDVFARHHVTEILNPLIEPSVVEKDRQSMDSMSFSAEWNAVFISGQSSYFSSELLTRCTEAYQLVESPLDEHKEMQVYLGADWARVEGGDRTVLTVVGIDREGHGRVLWLKTFEGTSYVEQANYVSWLNDQWRFVRVYSDATAFAVNDALTAHGVPIEPIQFSQQGKVELYARLKAAMEAGRLVIPNHPDLLRELSTFEYKISDLGNLLLHHVAGGHDDFPDSLALAARELTKERTIWTKESIIGTAKALSRLEEAYMSGSGRW
jgi:hypothetical protein